MMKFIKIRLNDFPAQDNLTLAINNNLAKAVKKTVPLASRRAHSFVTDKQRLIHKTNDAIN
jgi:hypothetical protein